MYKEQIVDREIYFVMSSSNRPLDLDNQMPLYLYIRKMIQSILNTIFILNIRLLYSTDTNITQVQIQSPTLIQN